MDFLELDKIIPSQFGTFESACELLAVLLDCDYIISFAYNQNWKEREEIIVRSFSTSDIKLTPEAASEDISKMAVDKACFLRSDYAESMGFDSNYTVMIASYGDNPFIRVALVLAAEKNHKWNEGDLVKFDMMMKFISGSYSLLENKQYTDTIIESLDTAIFAVSTEGKMVSFNKAAEVIFGCRASWAIGRNYVDTMAYKERGKIRSSFEYVMRTGHAFRGSLIELTCLNNKVVYLNTLICPWINTNGEIVGAIGIMSDETENKRFQDQLIKAEKMAILGQIAAQVSHELMSPLASIRGFARIIQKNESSGSKYYNYSNTIVEQVDRVSNILREMLDFSRPDETKQDPVDVNGAAKSAVSQVVIDRERVKLLEYYEQKLPVITGDFQKIERMFVNLIQNAYQSINESGVIEINTSFSADDDKVIVRIKDTGCGIPGQFLNKVFDPYFTTKPKGTGLGLAIVMQTVQSHWGKINISSDIGFGTCFTLEFPVRRDKDNE